MKSIAEVATRLKSTPAKPMQPDDSTGSKGIRIAQGSKVPSPKIAVLFWERD